ncbi:hypothetical protein FE246_08480 [Aliarcobacter thereius]|uniref:Lipoprotein n=1 Tax=Aliarcobacter thereius TaxID=544718 RepID=A0A5R9GXM0_9BACT|nr:hypothetical protein [Aliarcobacter thereius]TLS70991.1 hypothetical protein FE246_08480 [Aliarcobacter thereius]
MKKIISTLLLTTTLSTTLFADCEVLNFGEPNQNPIKLLGTNEVPKVVNYNAYSVSKPIAYYDSKNKMQIKSFTDAYGEFFRYVRDSAIEDCKEGGYKEIANVDIKFQIDERYYYFAATLNYIK